MEIIAERKNKIIYRDGDKAIKVFDQDFSKADVLNEALNQARVEETGLHIPKIIEVTTIDGKWALVYDYISGKTLANLMDENPEKIDEYLNWFVDSGWGIRFERLSAEFDRIERYSAMGHLANSDEVIEYQKWKESLLDKTNSDI